MTYGEFLAGMRDKPVHHYLGVGLEIVRETVRSDIPTLQERLKTVCFPDMRDAKQP